MNAGLFSDYACYMTASQTVVPGSGLDYRVLSEGAAGSDLEQFGKTLCDTFMDKCTENGRGEEAQLSFYDLDAAGDLLRELDGEALMLRKLYERTGTSYELFALANRARVADTESKSNLIDLMHFVNPLSFLDKGRYRRKILSRLDKMVLYQVKGSCADLNGVSIFFPLNYSEDQVEAYKQLSDAEHYCELLNEIYTGLPDETISFKDQGSIGEDGSFKMELTEESRLYIRNIILRVWKESEYAPGSYTMLYDESGGQVP